jgi:hypothetical protein
MVVVLGATLLSGLAPALLSLRTNLNETLKEGGRSGSTEPHSQRMQALCPGARCARRSGSDWRGSFPSQLSERQRVRAEVRHVAFCRCRTFYLSYAGYSAAEQRLFCRKLREWMEAEPGVIASHVLGFCSVSDDRVEPLASARHRRLCSRAGRQMMIHHATVSPGFFQVNGIPIREGRDFTERDDEKAPLAIIVNETFARRFLRGVYPVGRNLQLEGDPATIVGTVKDISYHSLTEGPIPYFNLPLRQWFAPGLNFAIVMKTGATPCG